MPLLRGVVWFDVADPQGDFRLIGPALTNDQVSAQGEVHRLMAVRSSETPDHEAPATVDPTAARAVPDSQAGSARRATGPRRAAAAVEEEGAVEGEAAVCRPGR